MSQAVLPKRLIRFTPFEFDSQTGELRKHGLKIRLSGQPIEVLTLLLEHPGEMVSREEMQKRLWPDDTVVEFEHSINSAINRLREALGDSADNARFVETLARRGYRFIALVDVGAGLVPALEPEGGVSPRNGRPRGAPLRKRWIVTATAATLVVLAVLLALKLAEPGIADRRGDS